MAIFIMGSLLNGRIEMQIASVALAVPLDHKTAFFYFRSLGTPYAYGEACLILVLP